MNAMAIQTLLHQITPRFTVANKQMQIINIYIRFVLEIQYTGVLLRTRRFEIYLIKNLSLFMSHPLQILKAFID